MIRSRDPIPPVTEMEMFAPLDVLGARLRSGAVTATDLANRSLERLERFGKTYHCVVTLARDQAMADASRADADFKAGRDRGPLQGIPYGAKDLFSTRGLPTTWGCAPFKSRVLNEDAAVIRKLRDAGAVLTAKLAMVEVAGGLGYNQADAAFTGPGLNPWDASRWSGGSSSGSGSAVAAGLVPFAVGTETWGSILTPSAYCGITGLRPTFGRVSRAGAMALSYTMDKIGPMARNAHDCGLILAALAGPDDEDPSATAQPFRYPPDPNPQRPFRLGALAKADEGADPDVAANFRNALEVFRKLGAVITEITRPDQPFEMVASTILDAEIASALEDMITGGQVFELTAPEDRIGGFAAYTMPATEYLRAQRLRGALARIWDAWLAPYDAVISLPVPTGAPPAQGRFTKFLRGPSLGGPGNLCGTPALVLPTGRTKDGLPTAVQLDARAFDDAKLLAVANAFQNVTQFHKDVPKVG